MTRPLYAPITSHLVVRKGEAKPWDISAPLEFAPRSVAPQHNFVPQPHDATAASDAWHGHALSSRDIEPHVCGAKPPLADAPHDAPGPAVKRCSIRLSHEEYERLGIIGIKKEMSRQAILREAIEHYLEATAAEYQARCGCLGVTCQGGC